MFFFAARIEHAHYRFLPVFCQGIGALESFGANGCSVRSKSLVVEAHVLDAAQRPPAGGFEHACIGGDHRMPVADDRLQRCVVDHSLVREQARMPSGKRLVLAPDVAKFR